MNPVVKLVLLAFSLCCFAFDAWQGTAPPTRVTCVGLALLVASMIAW